MLSLAPVGVGGYRLGDGVLACFGGWVGLLRETESVGLSGRGFIRSVSNSRTRSRARAETYTFVPQGLSCRGDGLVVSMGAPAGRPARAPLGSPSLDALVEVEASERSWRGLCHIADPYWCVMTEVGRASPWLQDRRQVLAEDCVYARSPTGGHEGASDHSTGTTSRGEYPRLESRAERVSLRGVAEKYGGRRGGQTTNGYLQLVPGPSQSSTTLVMSTVATGLRVFGSSTRWTWIPWVASGNGW